MVGLIFCHQRALIFELFAVPSDVFWVGKAAAAATAFFRSRLGLPAWGKKRAALEFWPGKFWHNTTKNKSYDYTYSTASPPPVQTRR
jgi:hypothetical protein